MMDIGKTKLALYDKLGDIWVDLEHAKEEYYFCYKEPVKETEILRQLQESIEEMQRDLSSDKELFEALKEELQP